VSAIVGIMNGDGRPALATDLDRMLQAVRHRGPDGMAAWSAGCVGLGHGLLQTGANCPSARQPILDDGLAIVADARLDNRDELLAALGLRQAASDAAVILGAYRRWGTDCASRLLGDFAFVVWDSREARLFCARDHMGVKPLYYFDHGGRLAFASEIKALLALRGAPGGVNEAWVADFLVGIVADTGSTLWSGILRLPPGHHLTAAAGACRLQAYWRPEPSVAETGRDSAERFRELFSEAVRCRLGGAERVGAMLSGGLDSSSIACVASRLLQAEGRCLPTFSLVFDKTPLLCERPSIEAVVAQGGYEPFFIESSRFAPLAEFDRVLAEQDGIVLAPGLTLSRQVYHAAAARGVRVLLDGHGGDEVVSHGYGRLRELAAAGRWVDLWREVPADADRYGTAPAWRLYAAYLANFGPAAPVLVALRRAAVRVQRRARRAFGQGERRPAWSRFIDPDFARRTDAVARFRVHAAVANRLTEREHHLGLLTAGLQPYALEVLDKVAAAAGVEARYPFWDKRLVEFCLGLPADAKLSGGFSRMVLRKAMDGILPAAVQWRRDKFDFTPHLTRGMLAHHRPVLDSVLLDDAEDIGGYVDLAAVREAYRRMAARGERADGYDVQAVWRAVALALWLRRQRRAAGDMPAAVVAV
jgi:asparagine synthase (glutamine-hydrolysing)